MADDGRYVRVPQQFRHEVLEDPESFGDLEAQYFESKVRYQDVVKDAKKVGITPTEYMNRYLEGDKNIISRVEELKADAHDRWLEEMATEYDTSVEKLIKHIFKLRQSRLQRYQENPDEGSASGRGLGRLDVLDRLVNRQVRRVSRPVFI